jgi:membrane protein DedA with SNARE-associated domain
MPEGVRLRGRLRVVLLALAAARTVLGVVAVLLAPALFEDHFVVLVLLRPTKEVFLAAGFLIREGDVNLAAVVLAAIPLSIWGVWLFYFLGRVWAEEIQSGKGLPGWATKVLPPERIQKLCGVVERKGGRVVVLGRLAAFPSTLLGAAAGTSGVEARRFLLADGVGGLLAMTEVLVAGFVLGKAYDKAGPWLTGVGAVVLVALLVAMGRWLKRESGRDADEGRRSTTDAPPSRW